MREIKFRVWNKLDEEYGSVKLINFNSQYIELNGADTLKFNQVIIEQYTGLKDKNGVEIYEGDNVLLNGKKRVIIIDEQRTAIEWQDSEYVKITDYLYKMCNTYYFNIEVIGNIHTEETK